MDRPGSPGHFSEGFMTDTRSWAYRIDENGEVEGRIFASKQDIPDGWADTPAAFDKAPEPVPTTDGDDFLKSLADMPEKEAKLALDQWAEKEHGIKLNRRYTLENMLKELDEALNGNRD